MRIITRKRLREFAAQYPDARTALAAWEQATAAAKWKNLDQVRFTYPHADVVRVASKREATVFNVRGNNYRLITAIHYDRKRLYVMRFLTHAEYNKDKWKDTL
jgi:mRNA interferase HigB